MLIIENLTKIYDNGFKALDNINLEIPDGQFVSIIGLSGSGKSTLLRCINRLIKPTHGRIIWNDTDITAANEEDVRAIRRRIGMIFQQFNLVKRSSVITNVLQGRLGYTNPLFSFLNYFPRSDRDEALANLERVGIKEQAYKRASALSGGQQQRVGIARALMQRPELMLADEPVASLDPATSHSVMKYLEILNSEDGITVLCSLHFLSLARTYSDRVIALKDGKLMFDGGPQEIDNARFKQIYGEDAVEVQIN
ncbi:MAG: phosphonate ABC transporter ATP-binding protein [Chloroflexi bacterium]|jgi:phosphonate transport system ATP-binding protein|nr:phosphonate ABC transporter ATP-binding protein [Chloroflexota bacterium]MBV6436877.1 Phosphate-import ATP-binding protein PhnC [Anaerolineae bacterium]MDL1915723.1 phosphonate ABC transporter ATP-binding protein [Anaerolineae bacterium CFX4]MBW7877816.1 phosphonate ABC transporter ATP-binding protein [Anaerolineae bacterium]MCC6564462.1 phosphonate ABC transporter ATP-binding protein [Chloroflexota bacterium]